MIPVSTGGGDTTPFVLDTGSGVTVLSQSLVDRLGGKPAGQFTGFRLTGERIDLQLFTIPELRVGPIVRHNVVVAGWDGLDKFHLSGMIALDFFRDQVFTLDFPAKHLVFESAASLAARRRHGSVVKTKFDDMRGINLDLFAPFKIDGKIGECEVDTGSQGYVFASRYMEMLGLTPKSNGVKESKHTTILGNTEIRYSAPVDSLTLGDTQIASSPHSSVLFEDIIYDCNVGIDFWTDKRRVLGYRGISCPYGESKCNWICLSIVRPVRGNCSNHICCKIGMTHERRISQDRPQFGHECQRLQCRSQLPRRRQICRSRRRNADRFRIPTEGKVSPPVSATPGPESDGTVRANLAEPKKGVGLSRVP